MIDQQAPVITIDGPGGSGKGTIAGLLARRLGWNLLDSGALYRLLAFAARNHGVDLTNEAALEALAAHLDVQFVAAEDGREQQIILEVRTSAGLFAPKRSALGPLRLRRCRPCATPCCSVSVRFVRHPVWSRTVVIWERWSSPTPS